MLDFAGGIEYVPTFLGGTDPDCAIGHVEPPVYNFALKMMEFAF